MHPVEWREISQKIYRFFAAGLDVAAASDLTQETLKRLLIKVQDGLVNPALGDAMSLAFGIALNVRREHLKAQVRTKLRMVNGEEIELAACDRANPEELLTLNRQVARLKSCICQLSAVEQEVISLMVDSEMTVSEAAQILGMPTGTIKSHMSRAKVRLRQLMK